MCEMINQKNKVHSVLCWQWASGSMLSHRQGKNAGLFICHGIHDVKHFKIHVMIRFHSSTSVWSMLCFSWVLHRVEPTHPLPSLFCFSITWVVLLLSDFFFSPKTVSDFNVVLTVNNSIIANVSALPISPPIHYTNTVCVSSWCCFLFTHYNPQDVFLSMTCFFLVHYIHDAQHSLWLTKSEWQSLPFYCFHKQERLRSVSPLFTVSIPQISSLMLKPLLSDTELSAHQIWYCFSYIQENWTSREKFKTLRVELTLNASMRGLPRVPSIWLSKNQWIMVISLIPFDEHFKQTFQVQFCECPVHFEHFPNLKCSFNFTSWMDWLSNNIELHWLLFVTFQVKCSQTSVFFQCLSNGIGSFITKTISWKCAQCDWI